MTSEYSLKCLFHQKIKNKKGKITSIGTFVGIQGGGWFGAQLIKNNFHFEHLI